MLGDLEVPSSLFGEVLFSPPFWTFTRKTKPKLDEPLPPIVNR